mmetsp:Transcript_8305/g.12078  ORF Transcript_8305/g.12078 Transcript_8305/m.12078 type:complete len:302 (+) Transcript_8305:63-968(+)
MRRLFQQRLSISCSTCRQVLPLSPGSNARSLSSNTNITFENNSVSKDEVKKFSKMNNRWWDHKFNPLITMNPVRMTYILETIQKRRCQDGAKRCSPLQGLNALDVGCGGGLLSESLSRLGASVTAIDPSSLLVEAALYHSSSQQLQIDYKAGVSIEDLAVEMQGAPNCKLFDLICIMEVIEHASNPNPIFQAASSLLKKPTNDAPNGGILFVSTLNRTFKSYVIAVIGAEYLTGKIPVGTHDWNQFYSPQEVETIATTAGMKVLDVCGMTLVPSSLLCGPMRWVLDKRDVDVNWIASYSCA